MNVAEVISIGDELTSGQRLDTNSQWLSQQLGDLGIRVVYHTTVADDLAANLAVFRNARDRADLIVCTGGLGPTADDLTRDAVAATAGVDLVLDEPSLQHIERLFARRQRPMPPSNRLQAMFPRGARVIPNPHGTAPGIDMDLARAGAAPARMFCLPGVPAEMREMWQATVAPAIEKTLGEDRRILRHFPIKCFGVGESDLEQMLPDIIRRGRDPLVGITASHATLTLRITASGRSPEECALSAGATIETIRQCLGTLVYSEQDEELSDVVARQLQAAGRTLTTVEIGTPGLLANWLAKIPDAAAWRLGGFTFQRDALPAEWRKTVDTAETFDTAALAELARRWTGADYGLAIGPAPAIARPGEPAGTIDIGLAGPAGTAVRALAYTGHPDILSTRTAKHALNELRLALLAG